MKVAYTKEKKCSNFFFFPTHNKIPSSTNADLPRKKNPEAIAGQNLSILTQYAYLVSWHDYTNFDSFYTQSKKNNLKILFFSLFWIKRVRIQMHV